MRRLRSGGLRRRRNALPGTTRCDPFLDAVDETRWKCGEDAAAEHDGNLQTGDAEAANRGDGERHDLVRLPVEDFDRGEVAGLSRSNDDRCQFAQSLLVEPTLMHGYRDIGGPPCSKWSATSRRSLVGPATSVLRPHGGAERRHADVGTAAPVAGDLRRARQTWPGDHRASVRRS